MSYRPGNYIQVQQRYRIINRTNTYANNGIIYNSTRSFVPGTKLIAYSVSPNTTITYQGSGDDLIPNATYSTPYFLSPTLLSDQNDSTCAISTTTLPSTTEQSFITFDLGATYSGFVRIYAINNLSNTLQIRVYTSPDNTNWTLRIDTGPNTGTFNMASYVSNIRYIDLRIYNGGNNITLNNSLGVCSLEFYPNTKFRTSLTFPDNTVRNVFVFSTSLTHVIEEVPIV